MNRTLAATVAAAMLVTGAALATWLAARPAECAWCPTYTCYAACSPDCPCIAPPGTSTGGKCYSVSRAGELVEAGWRLLE